MYTIRQAAELTGIAGATLRAWERRYQVVVPERSEAGYRLYDEAALEALAAMRRLVEAGWAPAQAAAAVKEGTGSEMLHASRLRSGMRGSGADGATGATEGFLAAAAVLDAPGLEEALDEGFALGSFEHVLESWLCPTLEALGEGWARGEIDVAGEHLASHAAHRRLAAAFEAAGRRARAPSVVVGLPPGSRHELGALAFATTARRIGLNVVYLGADVPEDSWQVAVQHRPADAVVMAVVMPEDRPAAEAAAARLRSVRPDLLVAVGGAAASGVGADTRLLSGTITAATEELDRILWTES